MKQSLLFLGAVLTVSGEAMVAPGAKIFVEPMDGFGAYVQTAFRVRGVPAKVVARRELAEFEVIGNEALQRATRPRMYFRLPGGGPNVVVLRLRNVKTGEVVLENTYATDKAHRGRRGGAEAFANEVEEKIRQQLAERKAASAAQTLAAVRFTSAPANADLEVDGVYWGTTPSVELTKLKAGSHTIVVKKPGFERWERKIEIAPGGNPPVHAELKELTAIAGKSRITGLR